MQGKLYVSQNVMSDEKKKKQKDPEGQEGGVSYSIKQCDRAD